MRKLRRLALVQQLLGIRQREIFPRLAGARFGTTQASDNGLLTANWRMADGATLSLLANLSGREIAHERGAPPGVPIWGGETGHVMPPWSVSWRIAPGR